MVKKQWDKLMSKVNSAKVIEIPLGQICRNPFQPRKEFKDKEIRGLAQSIGTYGIIQPIVVRKAREGYELVAGERRWRACKMLGIETIPAILQEMDDQQMATVSLIENLQRKDLNYFEEAAAYVRLINGFGMTQDEVAQQVGKSQSAVANKIRLLRLPRELRCLIITDTVTERHARALLKLNSLEMQKEVLLAIYDKELTVRDTEEIVERLQQHNLPQEEGKNGTGQQVSVVIKDARIFLNTIRETVKRARKIGIDMYMIENDGEEEYEIIIKVPHFKHKHSLAAKV